MGLSLGCLSRPLPKAAAALKVFPLFLLFVEWCIQHRQCCAGPPGPCLGSLGINGTAESLLVSRSSNAAGAECAVPGQTEQKPCTSSSCFCDCWNEPLCCPHIYSSSRQLLIDFVVRAVAQMLDVVLFHELCSGRKWWDVNVRGIW